MTTHRRLPLLERLDRSALLSLAPVWDKFIAGSTAPGPFLSWPWVGAWLETLGRDADLEVTAARDPEDGRLIGITPFHVVDRRRGPLRHRVLRLFGSGPAAPDHLDLPVARSAPRATAAMLWQAALDHMRWDVIDFDGVASGGTLHRLLERRASETSIEGVSCPYLPLDGTWEGTAHRFGRNHRKNLGRYARKMDREAGAPVSERMVADPADLETTIDALHRLHALGMERRGLVSSFGEELGVFHREAVRRMLAAGRLRLWRLDVGDQPAAIIECFRFGPVVSFYTTGFDPAWARYGPGRRIMARAIAGAIAEGATEFDFLRGNERYKESWGAEARLDLRLLRPSSRKGRILFAARAALKRRSGARSPA